jgi:quinol monooxygenase YgiN
MIFVVATITIKPGSEAAVRAAVAPAIAATLEEAGCLGYDLHQSVSDPLTFVFVERWETREALTAHSKTAHLKVWRDASGPHVTSRQIEVIHPEKIEVF